MKTFSEFLEESYACLEERTRAEILASMATGVDRLKKEPRLTRHAMISLIRSGKTGSGILRTANRFGKTSKQRARAKREKTIQDLRQYYPKTDYEKAEVKLEKIKRKPGHHGHHITPIHISNDLFANMTPEQQRARIASDAKDKIYHGHHPGNLMGTTTDKTPEDKRGRGIKHTAGGAHELESKTRDLPHPLRYDIRLLSVAHKNDLKKKKQEKEQANNQD
jgi:hypothetical protein